MKNLWDDSEAFRACTNDLDFCAYSGRLLGADTDVVLLSSGSVSVKIPGDNIFGQTEELVYIKPSGHPLRNLQAGDLVAVRRAELTRLRPLKDMSGAETLRQLRGALVDAASPTPSLETFLHSFLPAKFVHHTHPDAVLSLTNVREAEKLLQDVYGESVLAIPYIQPGFALARVTAELLDQTRLATVEGLILIRHGLVSFGKTARESYDRTVRLVTQAEQRLTRGIAPVPIRKTAAATLHPSRLVQAELRRKLSTEARRSLILSHQPDELATELLGRPDVMLLFARGPALVEQIAFTKRVPLIGRDTGDYAKHYREYFERNAPPGLPMRDAAPRVILDYELGLLTAGDNARQADEIGQLYRHAIRILVQAEALGDWESLSEAQAFQLEYGEVQQLQVQDPVTRPEFEGEVVVITSAASGTGRMIGRAFLEAGATVVGLDLNPAISALSDSPDFLGMACDLTNERDVRQSIDGAVRRFGGIDMLILSTGLLLSNRKVVDLEPGSWQHALRVNLDANLFLMRECHSLLRESYRGGRVVIVAPKNSAAAIQGGAAYSAGKGALLQLARAAAIEWGRDRIRVNVVHPDSVFDTGVWRPEVLQSRARARGLTVEAFKRNNVLDVEVSSRDVAQTVVALCSQAFAKTTGANIPVDGGGDWLIAPER
jgi:rhamnose utilization protein RhaD (predicted bifunctional aldolase and dehydrogenase)/NAD(P)-dependent dehydrogenase (short-subunit alcohol dehydrogenase family)